MSIFVRNKNLREMSIANPIYDSVFKYMMEDQRASRILLSNLLQREIVEVTLKNNEYIKKVNSDTTVLRLDFSARIRQADGETKVVTIEIQKALLPTEIMRFRKYLGKQFQADDNRLIISDKPLIEKPLHIVSIYLLGHSVNGLDTAVTYVYPKLFDQFGASLSADVEAIDFINGLTHDMIVVQIPKIKKDSVKTKLDKLLQLFNQEYKSAENSHVLNVGDDVLNQLSEEQKTVYNRLVHAKSEDKLCEEMDLEDEYVKLLQIWELEKSDYKKQINTQKEQINTQKAQMANMAKLLLETGKSKQEIASVMNISEQELNNLIL